MIGSPEKQCVGAPTFIRPCLFLIRLTSLERQEWDVSQLLDVRRGGMLVVQRHVRHAAADVLLQSGDVHVTITSFSGSRLRGHELQEARREGAVAPIVVFVLQSGS
jgi:hypothetical protein